MWARIGLVSSMAALTEEKTAMLAKTRDIRMRQGR
jgi:hypothetical protein